MDFVKLQIAGFKSFADRVDIPFYPGVTAFVGPNGCGKSNIVEALCWVMGESSSRRLRSSEMDDVIFAGSDKRASRNIAEVSLVIENKNRTPIPSFGNPEELVFTRKIERSVGSSYRVNDKEILARDFQTFFADLASGAGTLNIVAQGKIAMILQARPVERRVLLEEAAGTRGLHVRQREAGSKLRSAQENLLRLDDILNIKQENYQHLQKEATRAQRYHDICEKLKNFEIQAVESEWYRFSEKLQNFNNEKKTLLKEQAMLEAKAGKTIELYAEYEKRLEQQQEKHIAYQTALQKVKIEQQTARYEVDNTRVQENEISQRLKDIEKDIAHAEEAIEKAYRNITPVEEIAIDKAEEEKKQLHMNDIATFDLRIKEMRQSIEQNMQREGEVKARLHEYKLRHDDIMARLNVLRDRAGDLEMGIAKIPDYDRDVLESDYEKQRGDMQKLRDEIEAMEQKILPGLRNAEEKARGVLDKVRLEQEQVLNALTPKKYQIEAEIKTLQKHINASKNNGDSVRLIEKIIIKPGFEIALDAILGDDLQASENPEDSSYWMMPPSHNLLSLPEGITALSAFVKAPKVMAARLSQIGIVDDLSHGTALYPQLKVGQRLVDRQGNIWRWDGYGAKATGEHKSKELLYRNQVADFQKQLNQLEKETEKTIADYQERLIKAENLSEKVRLALGDSLTIERQWHRKLEDIMKQTEKTREKLMIVQKKDDQQKTLKTLHEEAVKLEQQKQDYHEKRTESEKILGQQLEKENQAASLQEFEQKKQTLHSELEQILTREKLNKQRYEQLREASKNWEKTISETKSRLQEWFKRRDDLTIEQKKIREKIKIYEKTGDQDFNQKIEEITQHCENSKKAFDRVQQDFQDTKASRSSVEKELGTKREDRVRLEAQQEQIELQINDFKQRIRRDFGAAEKELLQQKLSPEALEKTQAQKISFEELDQKIVQMRKRRDQFGGVNLCAQTEAEELKKSLDELFSEKEDLDKAILSLQQSARLLDRQAKEKLQLAFDKLSKEFSSTFQTLFNGGKAQLVLTDPKDLLTTGLEIMASPPGKKRQSLRLLSGGEQTMTALALLFAMFSVNPAPILVFDEVDAPLDDPNVVCFCDLLQKTAQRFPKTRFILITHHRMTMSRAQHLLGITMAEQGVSQIVSVDLEKAARDVQKKNLDQKNTPALAS